MFTIDNKVALITGAAQGIGFECAKSLLRKNLKAVALIDINEANGQSALHAIETEFGKNRAIFVKTDVSSKMQFEEAFKETVHTFNQLDIVINNAGIVQEIEWEKCISVNLVGTMMGSHLALHKYLPQYKNCNEGVILNVSSIAGLKPYEQFSAYTASKHGIIGFSRSIAGPVHYKMSSVRVVVICPHETGTQILHITKEQQSEPFLSAYKDTKEIPHLQSPHEVAEHAVKIIESASSGSVWRIDKNIRTEVKFEEL